MRGRYHHHHHHSIGRGRGGVAAGAVYREVSSAGFRDRGGSSSSGQRRGYVGDGSRRGRGGRGGGRGRGRGDRRQKMPSRRSPRVPRHMKTLVPVLETFVGIRVRVELRDGVEIVGVLDEVSFPFINLILLDATVHDFEDVFVPVEPISRAVATTVSGSSAGKGQLVVMRQRRQPTLRRMDRIFVAGHRIQYVHFPDRISMGRQLVVADKRIAQAKNMYSRGARPDKKPRGGGSAVTK